MLIGVINIYATGYSEENTGIFNLANRSGQQVIWVGVASFIAIMVMVIEDRFYTVFANFLYLFMLLLMVATLIFGKEINGNRSWLSFGPVGIQTVEFMKVATCMLLAKVMSSYGFRLQRFKDFMLACLVVVTPFALTLLQHDTGSALVFSSFIIVFYRAGLKPWVVVTCIFLIFLFILSLLIPPSAIVILLGLLCAFLFMAKSKRYKQGFIALGIVAVITLVLHFGLRAVNIHMSLYRSLLIAHAAIIPVALVYAFWNKLRYLSLMVGIFCISIGLSYSVDYVFENVLQEHQRRRINDLLGIESDLKGWGYNVHQSKVAIGSGGFSGKGFLEGTQTKGNFVPEQTTDFIFCTVGEEWGFLGVLVVVGLYLMLLIRLLNLAERQKNLFAKLYGYGVVSILFFHVFVNIGMTIGIMPVVGIPLPFISYGGSSLWAFTILIFILLNFDVSRFRD